MTWSSWFAISGIIFCFKIEEFVLFVVSFYWFVSILEYMMVQYIPFKLDMWPYVTKLYLSVCLVYLIAYSVACTMALFLSKLFYDNSLIVLDLTACILRFEPVSPPTIRAIHHNVGEHTLNTIHVWLIILPFFLYFYTTQVLPIIFLIDDFTLVNALYCDIP